MYFGRSKEINRVDVIYANEQLLTKLSNPFFFFDCILSMRLFAKFDGNNKICLNAILLWLT